MQKLREMVSRVADWSRLRVVAAKAIGVLATLAWVLGLRADAGEDLSALWSSIRENWIITLLYAGALSVAIFAAWPSIRRWLGIRDDGETKALIRYWLDEKLGYSAQTLTRDQIVARLKASQSALEPPTFQIDAELFETLKDGRRGRVVYALSVSKHSANDWIALGVNWGVEKDAALALQALSVADRAQLGRAAALALAVVGTRSSGVGGLAAGDAGSIRVALEERLYLDEPLTERRFVEAVQRLRFGFLALANAVALVTATSPTELPDPAPDVTVVAPSP